MTLALVLHIVFGGTGLISGSVALTSQKGAKVHLLSGKIFVVTMLLMAVTGFYLAYVQRVHISMLAACLTLYLVITSWLTVKKGVELKYQVITALTLGAAVSSYGAYLSYRAYCGVTDLLGDYVLPAAVYYLFTGIVFLALLMDFRFAATGELAPNQKVIRHLWRMCIPLYVGFSSFFSQQHLFPQSVQGSLLLSLPEISVLVVMLFWLLKVGAARLIRLKAKKIKV